MKNLSNSSAQSCSGDPTVNAHYENERMKYLECGLTDADGYQIPISKSPLQMTNNDNNNKLLNTMNQIVVLNTNTNIEEKNRRPAPVASVRRTQQLVDSTGSCSPPPTYSQLFKANEVVLNNELNSCELNPNALCELRSPEAEQRPDQRSNSPTSSQSPITQSFTSSHNQTKNYHKILVKTDNEKPESARMSNALPSSLSSSPVSCSTSSSNSPIIAAALLKNQSSLCQLSQPSRHLIETKYCFNGNPVHTKSVTNSSVEESEEDYDTDFDTETIAANDLYPPCDNTKQSIAPGPLITSFSNPLISSKINDQTQSKYAMITRLERKCTSVPSNNSFHYDTNSSWC